MSSVINRKTLPLRNVGSCGRRRRTRRAGRSSRSPPRRRWRRAVQRPWPASSAERTLSMTTTCSRHRPMTRGLQLGPGPVRDRLGEGQQALAAAVGFHEQQQGVETSQFTKYRASRGAFRVAFSFCSWPKAAVRHTVRGSSWIPGGAYPVTSARGIGAVTQGSSRLRWGARWQGGRTGLWGMHDYRVCGSARVGCWSWWTPFALGEPHGVRGAMPVPGTPARACNPSRGGAARTPRRSTVFVGQTPGFTPGHPAHRQRPLTHRGDTPPINVIDGTQLELRHEVKPGRRRTRPADPDSGQASCSPEPPGSRFPPPSAVKRSGALHGRTRKMAPPRRRERQPAALAGRQSRTLSNPQYPPRPATS
jgi:hypothetical protein